MIRTDLCILGAGPSGIAAAVQLKRYRYSPVLVERDRVGGLLKNAHLVENYPGFPAGINGVKLVSLFRRQLERFDIRPLKTDIRSVDYAGGRFVLEGDPRSLSCEVLLAATGTLPRTIPLPGKPEAFEGKVYYEVYPLRSVSGKEIAIIGAGDAAFDYALQLAERNRVAVHHRYRRVHALPVLQERVAANPAIALHPESTMEYAAYTDDNRLALTWRETDGKRTEVCDYLLPAVGRKPNLAYLSDSLLGERRRLEDEKRLFIIGDAGNREFRQVSIAVADGVRAAMEIWLLHGRRLK